MFHLIQTIQTSSRYLTNRVRDFLVFKRSDCDWDVPKASLTNYRHQCRWVVEFISATTSVGYLPGDRWLSRGRWGADWGRGGWRSSLAGAPRPPWGLSRLWSRPGRAAPRWKLKQDTLYHRRVPGWHLISTKPTLLSTTTTTCQTFHIIWLDIC